MTTLDSAKIVIRCRDFAASRDFYSSVLSLPIVDEWQEPGGQGCIFALNEQRHGGFIEIYEMAADHGRFHASFVQPLSNDKIDLQLRTGSVDRWAAYLQGRWPFDGPETLPWGQRWLRLRDPDALQIAIYEGQI